MEYGFIKKIVQTGEYVLGKRQLSKVVLQPTGQWDDFLPEYEPQFGEGWDTFCCTVWGTQNAIEILETRVFGIKSNYSERYTANIVPVRKPGSDPHKVAEAIRSKGLITEEVLPFTGTLEEFLTPMPITAKLLLKGIEWVKKYDFRHEWLWSGNPTHEDKIDLIKECLKYSPVGLSVTAWHLVDGTYVDRGQGNNHWCVCVGYMDLAERTHLKIFDSYDQTIKILHPDHHIEIAKRYSLFERSEQSFSLLRKVLNVLNLFIPIKH